MDTSNLMGQILSRDNLNRAYLQVVRNKGAEGVDGMKELICRSWGVNNSYKVEKLNQLIRGWINYFKIGSMKQLCCEMDKHIRFRLRMCIWKHWKTPQNRAKNLMRLDVPRWAAFKIAYCGDRYARLAHSGWVQKAISNKRLASFGLVSMLDYYTERCVTC